MVAGLKKASKSKIKGSPSVYIQTLDQNAWWIHLTSHNYLTLSGVFSFASGDAEAFCAIKLHWKLIESIGFVCF